MKVTRLHHSYISDIKGRMKAQVFPRLSICTATMNRGDVIGETLESIPETADGFKCDPGPQPKHLASGTGWGRW